MTSLLAALVFWSAVGIDYCATSYIRAVQADDVVKAMLWSVCQWSCSLVGFLVAVKVTLWMLPVEAAGLALGTYLSMRRSTPIPVARQVRER